MKLFKNKKNILFTIIAFALISCEDQESGLIEIGLDAQFISAIDSRTIEFTNISNDATNYSWDFGNGTSSTLINPSVTYPDNGTFTVVLTAFDDLGNTDTFEETFTIDIAFCTPETVENLDPEAGGLFWTFLNTNDDATFDAFGNTAGFIVENPVVDAVNSSCNVQRFEKTTGCETFAGLGVGLPNALDFSLETTGKVFKMKVLAETQLTEVTLRLEFMAFPNTEPSQDRVASITQLGAWQEVSFDFSDVDTGTFESMIIYFDRNATCDGDVYYFDDIVQ